MKVLIIGSGGREHAIAWKIAQSPRLTKLFIAPGNPGTSSLGENVALTVDDHPAVARFCREKGVDLVIIGPEAPLAAGIADGLAKRGIRVFGPRQAAAQIESSKAFAKQFMARNHIPTARFATFTDFKEAVAHLEQVEYPVVIKASGLAAGKGVVLPGTKQEAVAALKSMLVKNEFGAAGREVVIEERLDGDEVSLMAFSDGKTLKTMVPAQDHKRLLDGDRGPNTGGMGAYAPAPVCPPKLVEEATRSILLPAINGLRREGMPFVGVLFAGLILTADGPKALEFNCRFGDPETQAVLPLLESDLLDVVEACVDGRLKGVDVKWRPESAACVVLASEGYPGRLVYGKLTRGSRQKIEHGVCFHAGTRLEGGKVVTAGGRVFGVTAWAETLEVAVQRAYAVVQKISFDGMQYRRDIAHRALKSRSVYSTAGVSIEAGNKAVALMREAVRSTYTPAVLAGIGSFGGLFDAAVLKDMKDPVLVASTDGVGTKVKLAAQAGRFRSIGHDLVNHCVNDILVQGARPLFFLDYFATSALKPEMVAEVVAGVAEACKVAGCALLGGETAELPGVYCDGEFDLAGTVVGLVSCAAILPRPGLHSGDVLIGLASSGPHTNGYSLIRKVFDGVPLDKVYAQVGVPLADALLAPHRSYLRILHSALSIPHSPVKALAHLTGGGFIENIPRVLPDGLGAVVHRASWKVPPLFKVIQKRGGVPEEEMYRVFNMGIGMVAIVEEKDADRFQKAVAEETFVIGELVKGERKVILK
jgi:phosphoribosylamine--glycine ligase/phosphoribosylaminoimidazole synthetase